MTRRCFVIVGPENAGNRMLAGILIRAGCFGEATADHAWRLNHDLPDVNDPAPVVMIRSYPHGHAWPDLRSITAELRERGFDPFVLISCRDWSASDIGRRERGERHGAAIQQEAYRRIFAELDDGTQFRIVPYGSLALHPEAAVAAMLRDIGLPEVIGTTITVEGETRPIEDGNAVRYGVPAMPAHRAVRRLMPGLIWSPERGVGYYPVHGQTPYDAAYFDKYQGYADTPMGRALTQARINFVAAHWGDMVTDIGIGCGQFVEARGFDRTEGFDVNPAGIEWLKARDIYRDPYASPIDAATFWDSFEHIADPTEILACIRRWVFMSLPVFDGPDHALRSKHFRPDEHYWYFTRAGLVTFMAEAGFALRGHGTFETSLGREDIETFAFERTGA